MRITNKYKDVVGKSDKNRREVDIELNIINNFANRLIQEETMK